MLITISLRHRLRSGIAFTALAALIASSTLPALAQTVPISATARPAGDPAAQRLTWPREISAGALRILIYQPQIDRWDGHQLDSKAALSVGSAQGDDQSYGIVYFTARTDVDKNSRQVLLHEVQVTRVDMPGDPALVGATRNAVQLHWGGQTRTVSLDWLQASLAASQAWKSQQQAVAVDNTPPNILFSTIPAVLVLIDGEPVLQPVINSRYERVVNSNALILKHSTTGSFHLRVAGLWATAPGLQGPWSIKRAGLGEIDRIKAAALAKGDADILDDDDQPGRYGILPAIYISGVPIELLQSDGEPQYAAIEGTRLLYVANTVSDIFVDTASQDFHVLISGRWFRAGGIDGPWTYVDSAQLPEDFRRIPERHAKGDVLASIAGTPQAEEAAIANTIPQTATIDRQAAPQFRPVYDGAPLFQPVTGTPLHYAVNSPMPIVRVEPNRYYAVYNGAWYTGPSPTGPWTVADFVPPAIYAIPPSSPIYYATYVRVYGQDKRYVHVGYTPGYFGTYVTQRGTVVYGSGHRHRPWIAEAYYPRPASYGFGAAFVSGGFTGFSLGLATAAIIASPAWGPYWHRDTDRARRESIARDGAPHANDGRANDRRDNDGRDNEGRDQRRFSSNVYGQAADRSAVRSAAPAGRQSSAGPSQGRTQSAAPAAPQISTRERDRYRRAEEMRRDSQS